MYTVDNLKVGDVAYTGHCYMIGGLMRSTTGVGIFAPLSGGQCSLVKSTCFHVSISHNVQAGRRSDFSTTKTNLPARYIDKESSL